MPDVSDKLKAMNEVTSDLTQKNFLFKEMAMQWYDEIQNSLKDPLRSMNGRILHKQERLNKNEDVLNMWIEGR